MKVGDFALGRTKDERGAHGGIHRGEIIVLDFQGRNEKDWVKVAWHDTCKLIVVQVQEFHASIAHARKVGGNGTAQLIVVNVQQLDTVQGRGRLKPVGGDIACQAIVGEVQVKEKAQVPKFWNGACQVIVVYAQVA